MKNRIDGSHWYAVNTRSKCERVVERDLSNFCEVYLPMQWVKRKWSDRVKKLKIPLIPSYVFVKIRDGQSLPVYQNSNVLTIVNTRGKPLPIRDHEMNLVKRIEKSKIPFEYIREGYSFELGEKIEITTGPLFGVEGYIDRFLNQNSVSIFVPSLGGCFKTPMENISPHYSQMALHSAA